MSAKYGHRHRKLRDQVGRLVDAGEAYCARCGEWIAPGTPWDLGHVDGDPRRYSGPEHRRCNRATLTHARQMNRAERPSDGHHRWSDRDGWIRQSRQW